MKFDFRFDFFVHHVGENVLLSAINALAGRLDEAMQSLRTIQQQGVTMQEQIDALKREAEETNAKLVEVSDTLNALVDKIVAAQDDPEELAAIAAALDAGQQGVQPALDRAKAVLNPTPEEPAPQE